MSFPKCEKIKKNCKTCKKEFSIYPSQAKEGQGIFCSQSCRRPYKAQLRKCEYCQEEYWAKPCYDRKNKTGKTRFCSLKCWYSINKKEKHINWRGGQAKRFNENYWHWKGSLLKRDKECRMCGVKDKLEAHHIIPYSDELVRWEISNGIILCKKHHHMVAGCEEDWQDYFFNILECYTNYETE